MGRTDKMERGKDSNRELAGEEKERRETAYCVF